MSHFRSIFRLISTNNSYQVVDYGPNNNAFDVFLPTDYAGLTLWVDPSDAVYVTSSGGYIDAITNKGSVACTVQPNVVSARPFLSESLVNGRNVASFDGVDDVISSSVSAASLFGKSPGERAATYTVATTIKFNRITTADSNPYSLDVIAAEGNASWMFSIGTAHGLTSRVWIDQGATVAGLWTRTNAAQIASGNVGTVIVTYATGTRDMYYNGTFVSGTDPAVDPFMAIDSLRIGGEIFPSQGAFSKMELCEFLLYTGSLKSEEITKIHTYFADRWGI